MRLPLVLIFLTLAFGCGGDDDGNGTGPVAGSIQVTVSTSGDDPPGTYSLTLDGVEVAQIAASGGITIPGVSAGLYAVGISPVPANCTVAGDNPVHVSVIGGSESRVIFAVQCVPQTGAIDVTTVTTGDAPDPNGYFVLLDGGNVGAIGANDNLVISDLSPRTYSVGLVHVEFNCTVDGANPRNVTAIGNLTEATTFNVDCPTIPVPGTYELVSFTQGGITLGPPIATGTLALTQTNYSISITHPNPDNPAGPPLTTVDNGTYSTDGNVWTQESANAGGFQGVGTFTLVGGTLTIDVTTAGVQVLTVWSTL